MYITSSQIGLQARHQLTETRSEEVSVETWRAPESAPRPDTLSISERAYRAAALPSPLDDAEGSAADALAGADPAGDDGAEPSLPPGLGVIKQVLEDLLGIRIRVYRDPQPADDAASPDPPANQRPLQRAPGSGGGFALQVLRTRSASESLQVVAQGTVTTDDGRRIDLSLQLNLLRQESHSEFLSLSAGVEAPRRKDPLVINLSGGSVQLGDRFEFDLDADGVAEVIPGVTGGSGFVALDRNGNGRIDDGSELFGAQSGNGFADLAALDEDGNGWIDETDSAFAQLAVWQPGGALRPLAEAGVGALYTGSAAGDFSYTDSDGKDVAQVRRTGLFLNESGSAGSLQQVDFFT